MNYSSIALYYSIKEKFMGILTSERISYAYNHFLPIQKLYKAFHINIDNYTFEELPFLNK